MGKIKSAGQGSERLDSRTATRQVLFILLSLLILQGCAFFNIKKAGRSTSLAEGEAIIIGTMVFLENGMKLTPYGFFKRPSPTVFHAESGRYSWTITGRNGEFSWVVPAGSYIVPEVQFGSEFIRPKLAFIAPEPGKVYYVGAVRVDITYTGTMAKGLQVNDVTVLDAFESSGPWPLDGELLSKTEKSLMIHDPTLPTDLTDRESVTNFLSIFGTIPK